MQLTLFDDVTDCLDGRPMGNPASYQHETTPLMLAALLGAESKGHKSQLKKDGRAYCANWTNA